MASRLRDGLATEISLCRTGVSDVRYSEHQLHSDEKLCREVFFSEINTYIFKIELLKW